MTLCYLGRSGWLYHHFIAYAKEDQSVQIPLLTTLILGFEDGPALIWMPLPSPAKTVKTIPYPIGKELDRPVVVMVIPLLNADGESPAIFALSIKIRWSPFCSAIYKARAPKPCRPLRNCFAPVCVFFHRCLVQCLPGKSFLAHRLNRCLLRLFQLCLRKN